MIAVVVLGMLALWAFVALVIILALPDGFADRRVPAALLWPITSMRRRD